MRDTVEELAEQACDNLKAIEIDHNHTAAEKIEAIEYVIDEAKSMLNRIAKEAPHD
jgi:hypothetical protein